MKKLGHGPSEGKGDIQVDTNYLNFQAIARQKQILKNVSAGHTGPGGAQNPKEIGGNTEASLKQNRYDKR